MLSKSKVFVLFLQKKCPTKVKHFKSDKKSSYTNPLPSLFNIEK